MISPASTAGRYTRTISSASARRSAPESVRAGVFAKAERELLDLQADANVRDQELRTAEKSFLMRHFDLPEERIVMLKQIHGDRALQITSQDLKPLSNLESETRRQPEPAASSELFFAEGDALYTREPGVLLTIRTADCLPLLFDLSLSHTKASNSGSGAIEKQTVVGIIHAGWRGLAAGIINKTLQAALAALYRPVIDDLNSARFTGRFRIGPCIGPDSYEVGEDVARLFSEKKAIPNSEKYLLDLAASARLEIQKALKQHAGEIKTDPADLVGACDFSTEFEACTFQANDRFFSHRRGDRGRNLNTIMIEE